MPLPAPTVTTLGQLMDSSGNFYFDPTRQTGAEHLQGTLVQLNGVRLLSGTWAPNNQVVVTDGSLRQMILNLGNNPNLTDGAHGGLQRDRNSRIRNRRTDRTRTAIRCG